MSLWIDTSRPVHYEVWTTAWELDGSGSPTAEIGRVLRFDTAADALECAARVEDCTVMMCNADRQYIPVAKFHWGRERQINHSTLFLTACLLPSERTAMDAREFAYANGDL